jgi:hypothetical protein
VQPALVLAGSSQATAVEIPDDDVPPLGWDQWASLPTSAPESQAGVLIQRWDGRMVAGGSRYSAEASSSRAGLPTSGGPVASPEQGQECIDAPPPTSPTLRRSSIYGRSCATTAPRSTGR